MDTPYCDVIGCGAHAQWFLVSERDGQIEEQNLCQNHWRQLMADRSRRVIRWSRAAPQADSGAPCKDVSPGQSSRETHLASRSTPPP